MFARKAKSSDLQNSLQRFADLNRDTSSRTKHFRILYEHLGNDEKVAFCSEYCFEIFHLVDTVLSNLDLAIDNQGVFEAENALWSLEQLLTNVPDLIGQGWQKHAIESLLRRGLHPGNMFAVRKMCIRLFLCWYQALHVYGNTNALLDQVFQNLLPFFPLRGNKSTLRSLTSYCEGSPVQTSAAFNPLPPKIAPIIPNAVNLDHMSLRDRAQNLQIYLDKFLEYTCREVSKLRWKSQESREMCAGFIFGNVCRFYIAEVFPQWNRTEIDLLDKDQDSSVTSEVLDTADPLVIARYWLIRWVTNIASSAVTENAVPGLPLFKKWLYASESSVNMLFVMLRSAMQLPLACSSVIQKMVALEKVWLLEMEVPSFLNASWSGKRIDPEQFYVMLVKFLFAFFRSPYIPASGERLPTVVALSQTIFMIVRDLVYGTEPRSTKLSSKFWTELLSQLVVVVRDYCCGVDVFDSSTCSIFIRILLASLTEIYVFRRIDLSPAMWETVSLLFQTLEHSAYRDQWCSVIDMLTYSMTLNVLGVLLNTTTLHPIVGQCVQLVDDPDNESDVPLELYRLARSGGDSVRWLRLWMRVVALLPLDSKRSGAQAVQTLDRCTRALLQTDAAHFLVHWIGYRLLLSTSTASIPVLSQVLVSSKPDARLRAHILAGFRGRLQFDETANTVISQFLDMSTEDAGVLATDTITTLKRLVNTAEFSSQAVKVASVLALNSHDAEEVLFSVLNSNVHLDSTCLATVVNAFSVIALERNDFDVAMKALALLSKNPEVYVQALSQFCDNLVNATRLGFGHKVVNALEAAMNKATQSKQDALANEVKWHMVSLLSTEPVCASLKTLLANIATASDDFFEGFLCYSALQYPLPGFSAAQWNSVGSAHNVSSVGMLVVRPKALISNDSNEREARLWSRTVVGKHCLTLKVLSGLPIAQTPTEDWLNGRASDPADQSATFPRSAAAPACSSFLEPVSSHLPNGSASDIMKSLERLDTKDFLHHVMTNRRKPLEQANRCAEVVCRNWQDGGSHHWRSLVAGLNNLCHARRPQSSQSFVRDIRHLDQTGSREVHKVAIIYVGMGSEDKQSILGNSRATPAFNDFVDRLGWPVTVGAEHYGYSGGLPSGCVTPYYANSHFELIFHVSTRLPGDVTQRLKHLGNDEVHVVWTEHSRSYRRDVIATRFCDVLIVLQPVSANLARVRIEVQQPEVQFGPLFDGAQVHVCQLPELVRETVVNASRAYRISQPVVPRPNKHREQVFQDTVSKLYPMSIAESISSVYTPTLKA